MSREIPQYVSQLTMGSMPLVRPSGLQAQTESIGRVSQQAAALSNDMMEKANRISELSAITDLRENLHRISLDSGADPAAFKANADGYVKGWIKSIKSPELAQKLELHARNEIIPFIDRATEKYNHNLNIEQETVALKAQQQNIATVGAIAPNLYSQVPEQRRAAQDSLARIFEESASIATMKKADGTFMFTPDQQLAMAADVQKELIVTLPPEKRLQALSANTGGFEEAIRVVFANEGGYNPSDGGTGVPVNFGINQKAHPNVDVKNLTQQQAVEIYKTDYWDKFGIESLRPDQQAIVLDAVVNQGNAKFRKELLDAAKNGASPTELLDIRRKEYGRLASSGKYPQSSIASWEKRLSSFEHFSIGEHLALIPGSMREKLKESTLKELEMEMKLRADDPAKWGGQRGMNTAQIVAMQPNPMTASVLPIETAKQVVQKAKEFNSPDEIVQLAGQLANQYQEYTPNALNDLVKQKLPLAQATAINLALENAPGNMDRISLLHEISKMGGDNLNKAYREIANTDPKSTDLSVASEYEQYINSLSNEGASLEQITEGVNLSSSIAKAYKIKNPDVNEKEAIEFALKHDKESYKIGKINGADFRIPARDKTGMLLNASEIENRLDQAIKSIPTESISIGELDSTAAKLSNKSIVNLVRPFLSATKDGVMFRLPSGDVLKGNDGVPMEMKFSDIISMPTKSETLGKLIVMPLDTKRLERVLSQPSPSDDFLKTPSNMAN